MNRATYEELRQLVEKHGCIEAYDSKDEHIMAHIYIDSEGKLRIKLPDENDVEISKK